MPEISPGRFFRFAADHGALLVALYYRRERIGEADLLELIRKHAPPGGAASTHVLGQLLDLGFCEASPDATADYEMTRHVANLMGTLLRQFRLTSVEVIGAYVDALREAGTELEAAITSGQPAHVVRVLNETADHVERLRQDSRNNRDAIIAEAVRTRANLDQLGVRERYEGINRLWTRYIIPMRDMIDERKVLDATLDGLDRILIWSAGQMHDHPVARQELQGATSRLRRMRRDVQRDFHESLAEISPLYHDLQRDSRLVRGAVVALETADRRGSAALELPDRLGLPVWRLEGQLDDGALSAWLHAVVAYDPRPPRPLARAAAAPPDQYIDPDDLGRRVARDAPLADAWPWLIGQYPDAPLAQLLRAHGKLRAGDHGPARLRGRPRTHETATHAITAPALEIDRAPR